MKKLIILALLLTGCTNYPELHKGDCVKIGKIGFYSRVCQNIFRIDTKESKTDYTVASTINSIMNGCPVLLHLDLKLDKIEIVDCGDNF
jgi:hypothetical protein